MEIPAVPFQTAIIASRNSSVAQLSLLSSKPGKLSILKFYQFQNNRLGMRSLKFVLNYISCILIVWILYINCLYINCLDFISILPQHISSQLTLFWGLLFSASRNLIGPHVCESEGHCQNSLPLKTSSGNKYKDYANIIKLKQMNNLNILDK